MRGNGGKEMENGLWGCFPLAGFGRETKGRGQRPAL